ncbi:DNA-binding response regulator [Azospira sp. I13]|uniref:response regulator transcription factor n=1 Tax=Azospira sp. I13 TaxID=1765050 RepID=UPI000D4C3D50|nr:response regulator transcription factor [Azospira sp. I13]GBG02445.1 DNA-binding response regulator [Azospira sp. I13]
MHILIVEDDRPIAENLYEYLESRGHQCDYADNLAAATRRLAEAEFDCAVLDRSLPDGDGLSLARRLRAEGSSLPLLILTARDTLEDKLAGFDAGADDYLVKPFALQEVEARLQVLARRAAPRKDTGTWRQGPLEYDAAAQEIRLHGQALHLPPKALRLTALLLQQPNRVFSRRELEIAIWGREQEASDNLRSLLHTLRRALGEDGGVEVINVHGLGYKLVAR